MSTVADAEGLPGAGGSVEGVVAVVEGALGGLRRGSSGQASRRRQADGGRDDRDAARVTVGEGQLPSVVHRHRQAVDAELVDVLRDAGERRIRRGGDVQRGAGADLYGDVARSRREGAGAGASHHVGGRGRIGLLVVQLDRSRLMAMVEMLTTPPAREKDDTTDFEAL